MMYAVVQDGYAIFGVGSTAEAAVADAREWVSDPDTLDDLPDRPRFSGDMYLAPCTSATAGDTIRVVSVKDE